MDETESRRDSLMSSFKEGEINEGSKNIIPNRVINFQMVKQMPGIKIPAKKIFEMNNEVISPIRID